MATALVYILYSAYCFAETVETAGVALVESREQLDATRPYWACDSSETLVGEVTTSDALPKYLREN